MFGIENYGVFILSGILLNLTPGADTMYILGRSISQGKKAGAFSVLGIGSGALIHTLLVAFGLSVIFQRSAWAFNVLKSLGAVYLCYLGIKAIISKSNNLTIEEAKQDTPGKVYIQGLLTNLFNPKVALFFLAFLPQFIMKENHYGAVPFLILGLTFVTTGTVWCLFLALFASGISRRLRENQRVEGVLNKLTGVLFIVLGLNLLRQKI